jgi:hypothetical protein
MNTLNNRKTPYEVEVKLKVPNPFHPDFKSFKETLDYAIARAFCSEPLTLRESELCQRVLDNFSEINQGRFHEPQSTRLIRSIREFCLGYGPILSVNGIEYGPSKNTHYEVLARRAVIPDIDKQKPVTLHHALFLYIEKQAEIAINPIVMSFSFNFHAISYQLERITEYFREKGIKLRYTRPGPGGARPPPTHGNLHYCEQEIAMVFELLRKTYESLLEDKERTISPKNLPCFIEKRAARMRDRNPAVRRSYPESTLIYYSKKFLERDERLRKRLELSGRIARCLLPAKNN